MKYKVTMTGSNKQTVIIAKSELEAKIKYCQQEKLLYRVYLNKLTVEEIPDNEK